MLVGYRVHGIRRPQDLTIDMARDQARNGWLTDAQYLAILANPDKYQGLIHQGQILSLDTILNGQDECFFMCHPTVDDTFEHDVDDTYGVRFDGVWRMTVRSCYSDVYEKREYTMRNSSDLKLVHYRPNNDQEKLDKVQAMRAASHLEESIVGHGQSCIWTAETRSIAGHQQGASWGGEAVVGPTRAPALRNKSKNRTCISVS